MPLNYLIFELLESLQKFRNSNAKSAKKAYALY